MPGFRTSSAIFSILALLIGCTSGDYANIGSESPRSITSHSHDSSLLPQQSSTWKLGEPDLIVQFPKAFQLSAGSSDVFRNFVIPNLTSSDRYVRALDIRLANQQVVHHAEVRLDESETSLQRDLEDAQSGFNGMDNTAAHNPDGHFVNWVPGKQVEELHGDLAWKLPAAADLVLQLHMMPSDTTEIINPEIGLYFAEDGMRKSPKMIWLGSRWLPIQANDSSFIARDNFSLPLDVEVLSVLPHCHYICIETRAWATLPNGGERWLINKQWDFYNQEELRFEQALELPRGTRITMEFVYDNSQNNNLNPNHPPKDINFGPRSSDEMADLWIQVMTNNDSDGRVLNQYTAQHLREKIIEQLEHQIAIEPSVDKHIELARNYRLAEQHQDAVAQLQSALAIAPQDILVIENLAIALTDLGRHSDALVHWRQLVDLAPQDARVTLNLGMALFNLNRAAEAEVQLSRATELDSSFESAYFQLGRTQSYLGRFDDALTSYRAALSLNPDAAGNLLAVSRLLSTHPDANKRMPDEALGLARQALAQRPVPDALSLSILAMAHGAAGDFELAVTTARKALDLLNTDWQQSLAQNIRRQIHRYEQRQIEVARAAGTKRFISPEERRLSSRPIRVH